MSALRVVDGIVYETAPSNFVVVTGGANVLHGAWEEQADADRFAESMGDRFAVSVRVYPYTYARGYGMVAS